VARRAERELIALRLPETVLRLDAHGRGPGRPVLVPLLAGPGAAHVWYVDGELTHVAYPVCEAWRLLDESAPPPAELDSLLGTPRTRILRFLDRPATAGRLAEALLAVPSAATHHLAILERAGLVMRERRGRSVLVHRTARGTDLLALYGRP
jgi:DNA-binding transcriptional ArsR family regulator